MVYTYDYDAKYQPAMPVVEIRIGRSLITSGKYPPGGYPREGKV